MTIVNEKTRTNRQARTYNSYDRRDVDEIYRFDRRSRLSRKGRKGFLKGEENNDDDGGGGGDNDDDDVQNILDEASTRSEQNHFARSFRRRLFLFLTEPSNSFGSALYFFILIFGIFASNVIIVLKTMTTFQYTPIVCRLCGGEDGNSSDYEIDDVGCVCAPRPYPYLDDIMDYILVFFAIEWTLRVITYTSQQPSCDIIGKCNDWFFFIFSPPILIDALAIWPHFVEGLNLPGLVSLRLLRLFRVFQLVRLGKYNAMFVSLTNVLYKSLPFLRLMVVVLLFGASIFGSLLFWLEEGTWKYWEPTHSYQYVRMSIDGTNEEISPFKSIPTAFWWWFVTATTVGYGDLYPTSPGGRIIASFAMLFGVLVLAFPVSVFSDLWSEELKELKGFESMIAVDSSSDNDNIINGDNDDTKLDGKTKDNNNDLDHQLPRRSDYQEIQFEEFRSKSSTHVVMDKADLNEIVSSIYTIQQNQKQIQRIMKKYYLQADN